MNKYLKKTTMHFQSQRVRRRKCGNNSRRGTVGDVEPVLCDTDSTLLSWNRIVGLTYPAFLRNRLASLPVG